MDFEALHKTLTGKFGEKILGMENFRDQPCIQIDREAVLEILGFLRDDESTQFNMLTDVTAVDYQRMPAKKMKNLPERFAVVYHLTAIPGNHRLRVKAFLPEDDCYIDSVISLWLGADYAEREVYDMYGIEFDGHPDLRRILMPEDYDGHPLRKDYPLKGRGERDNFEKYTEMADSTQ